jgi:hypothetical protein
MFSGSSTVVNASKARNYQSWQLRITAGSRHPAYQTLGDVLIAGPHALAIVRPTTGVRTSAYAIRGIILTARPVRYGFCLKVKEHSDAHEGDREEKVSCHVRTS